MYNYYEINQEDKSNKQECYGHYCNKCKSSNVKPILFSDFSIEFWNKFRKGRD